MSAVIKKLAAAFSEFALGRIRNDRGYYCAHFLMGALLLLVPGYLWAQAVNRISGIVTDQSGGVIVGATITARNLALNISTSTQSNESGYYVLQLPVGVYEVKVSQQGFRTVVREKVQLTVGADIGTDFVLNVETKEQSIDVVGEATPLLTPNSAAVQTTVENDLVSSLPLAVSGGLRNSADFLKVTPGYQGDAFSARINGGVGLDQEVTIDGATVSPVAFGAGIQGAQNTVPAFAVQEFQIVGSNIEAQYGRTSTSVIKYVYRRAAMTCMVRCLSISVMRRWMPVIPLLQSSPATGRTNLVLTWVVR